MKTIVRIFYFASLIFWGGLFIRFVLFFAAYNGFGTIFQYIEAKDAIVKTERDSVLIYVNYTYSVDEQEFSNEFKSSVIYYDSFNIEKIVIKYNQKFPTLSIVKGLPNNQRREKVGAMVCLIFIGLQTFFYRMAIRKKSLAIYGG